MSSGLERATLAGEALPAEEAVLGGGCVCVSLAYKDLWSHPGLR